MTNELEKIDEILQKIEQAKEAWKDSAAGRVYDVGTKILYEGKFGVVTDLNQGSTDPQGSTVDIRLGDGKTIQGVSVSAKALQFYRA